MATEEESVSQVESSFHEPFFEPLVQLDLVEVKTLEESEDELFKMRGRLYRFDNTADPPEWKERGTGDVKILKHRENGSCRILMRREITFKICANHYILPGMELKSRNGSSKIWYWYTYADYADETPKPELLALRFGKEESAKEFQKIFDEALEGMKRKQEKEESNVDLAQKLSDLSFTDKANESRNSELDGKKEEEGDEKTDKKETAAENDKETTVAKEGKEEKLKEQGDSKEETSESTDGNTDTSKS